MTQELDPQDPKENAWIWKSRKHKAKNREIPDRLQGNLRIDSPSPISTSKTESEYIKVMNIFTLSLTLNEQELKLLTIIILNSIKNRTRHAVIWTINNFTNLNQKAQSNIRICMWKQQMASQNYQNRAYYISPINSPPETSR